VIESIDVRIPVAALAFPRRIAATMRRLTAAA
jgi:hypothetical protein